jgi:hypothetical protein
VEWFEFEAFGKSMVILAIFAFSLAQGCLLALVPLRRPVRWVFLGSVVIILALATLISGMIVFEPGEEWLFRLAGVLGILDGCGSLTIPVLYKLGHKTDEGGPQDIGDRIELRCPRCGHRDTYRIGPIQCQGCLLEMRVEIPTMPADRCEGGSTAEGNHKAAVPTES